MVSSVREATVLALVASVVLVALVVLAALVVLVASEPLVILTTSRRGRKAHSFLPRFDYIYHIILLRNHKNTYRMIVLFLQFQLAI